MALRVPDIVTMSSQGRESSFAPFDLVVPVHEADLDGSDDQLALFDFGPITRGKLWHLFLTFDDLDGGAALDVDIDLIDEDGDVVTTLVAGDTTGQAGGEVTAVHLGSDGGPEDLDGVRYLAISVNTPAGDPQAGNIRVEGFYSPNV